MRKIVAFAIFAVVNMLILAAGTAHKSDTVSKVLLLGELPDEVTHFAAFCILTGAAVLLFFTLGVNRPLFLGASYSIFGSVAIELIQSALPYRTVSLSDIIWGICGVIACIDLLMIIGKNWQGTAAEGSAEDD